MSSIPVDPDAYRGRKVLVAGGDGFIGYNCCRRLVALGAEVTSLSRRAVPGAACRGVQTRRVDLADRAALAAAVGEIDIVFDCVGASGAVDSNADPYRNFDIECRPHMNLFDVCARLAPAPTVVFLSSRLVYGRVATVPVSEREPLAPASFYAVHKVTLENYLQVFARTRALPFVVLRVANPYGPGPAALDKGYGVINQFIAQALGGAPIRVFGEGSQLRDYVYIDDLVETMLAVAPRPECRGEIFNMGSGQGISVIDAIRTIVAACGGRSVVEHVPWPEAAQQVETGDFVANIDKLQGALGACGMTAFADGVAATVASERPADAG
jgi:UDP-glucose 4-epimerase